jgi:purine-binding chemotaxis protein CheW
MENADERTDFNDLYDELDEDTQKDKFLTFRIGKESYGIEIRHVTEIVVMQDITEVPDMPDFITGVINLRGKVISVMDVRRRFGLEPREFDERTCIIVVDINEMSIGLIVDTVNEVLNIPQDQIDPPPRTHSGIKSNYIQGMGKVDNQVKILLDVEKILYEEELEQLAQV